MRRRRPVFAITCLCPRVLAEHLPSLRPFTPLSAMESSRLYCALCWAIGLAAAAPVPSNSSSVEVESIYDYNATELRMLIVVGVLAVVLWFARVAYYCRMEDKLGSEDDKNPENVEAPRYFFSPR